MNSRPTLHWFPATPRELQHLLVQQERSTCFVSGLPLRLDLHQLQQSRYHPGSIS